MEAWYALYTRANAETTVAAVLEACGPRVFLRKVDEEPWVRRRTTRGRGRRIRRDQGVAP